MGEGKVDTALSIFVPQGHDQPRMRMMPDWRIKISRKNTCSATRSQTRIAIVSVGNVSRILQRRSSKATSSPHSSPHSPDSIECEWARVQRRHSIVPVGELSTSSS